MVIDVACVETQFDSSDLVLTNIFTDAETRKFFHGNVAKLQTNSVVTMESSCIQQLTSASLPLSQIFSKGFQFRPLKQNSNSTDDYWFYCQIAACSPNIPVSGAKSSTDGMVKWNPWFIWDLLTSQHWLQTKGNGSVQRSSSTTMCAKAWTDCIIIGLYFIYKYPSHPGTFCSHYHLFIFTFPATALKPRLLLIFSLPH